MRLAEAQRRSLAENGPGIAVSGAVHLAILLMLIFVVRQAVQSPDAGLHTVLVEIVRLGDDTTSPPAPQRSTAPAQQASAPRAPAAHSPPTGTAPHKPQ